MKKQLVLLGGLAAVMLALCLGVWAFTGQIIAENRRRTFENALQAVVPGATQFTPEAVAEGSEYVESVWKSPRGYAIETEVYGYHGELKILVGVDAAGKILGVKILEIAETPGLGREAKTDAAFLRQFVGTRADAALDENIDALSSATVTTKAVIRAVNAAAAYVSGADVSAGATQWRG